MRRLTSVASLLVLASAVAGAQTTATFVEYASPVTTEYQATPGSPVTSGGLDFYAFWSNGARNALATWGTADFGASNIPTNIGGSTAMFDFLPADEIDMYAAGAYPFNPRQVFNLYSIDVAHLWSTETVPVLGTFNLTFNGVVGQGLNGPVITQTFTINAPTAGTDGIQRPVLQTLMFDNRWRNLSNVYWFQNGQSLAFMHQFTNVTAQVLPEPSTYALMATGLLGVLAAARRRRVS